MKEKLSRFAKNIFVVLVTWVIAKTFLHAVNFILYALNPGWLIIVLMNLSEFVLPIAAAFIALAYRFYQEAVEDGTQEDSAGGFLQFLKTQQFWKSQPSVFDAALTSASGSDAKEMSPTSSALTIDDQPIPDVLMANGLISESDPASSELDTLTDERPLPDASSWNSEIPGDELLSFYAQHPYYDCSAMRCVSEKYDDYRNRFVDLEKFIVLDIETTGLSRQASRIIEVAAVKFERFQVVDTFSCFVDPEIPLPSRITELTGITQRDLDGADTWERIEESFLAFIGDYPLVGHNLVGFDSKFIEDAIGASLNNPLVDTLDYSRHVFPELPRHKLSFLKSALGINVATSHRALDDVKTTFFLLVACMKEDFKAGSVISEIPTTATDSSFVQYIPPMPEKPKKKYRKHIDTKAIVPTCANIDQKNPLFGKRIVFTGTLSIPRENAMQLAVNNGALIRKSVSGKTDYLIVGEQDLSIVGPDGLSTKQRAALQLNESDAANIQIIDEKAFFNLISK